MMPELPLMCDTFLDCWKACQSFAADRGVEIVFSEAVRMCHVCYAYHRCSDGRVRLRRREVNAESVLLIMCELGGVVIDPEPPSDLTRECCQSPLQDTLPGPWAI